MRWITKGLDPMNRCWLVIIGGLSNCDSDWSSDVYLLWFDWLLLLVIKAVNLEDLQRGNCKKFGWIGHFGTFKLKNWWIWLSNGRIWRFWTFWSGWVLKYLVTNLVDSGSWTEIWSSIWIFWKKIDWKIWWLFHHTCKFDRLDSQN